MLKKIRKSTVGRSLMCLSVLRRQGKNVGYWERPLFVKSKIRPVHSGLMRVPFC